MKSATEIWNEYVSIRGYKEPDGNLEDDAFFNDGRICKKYDDWDSENLCRKYAKTNEVIMKIYFVKTNAYNDVCFDYPEEQKCYMLNPKNGYVDGNKELDLYSEDIVNKLEAYYKRLISEDLFDANGEYYDYSEEGRESFFDGMELHEIIVDVEN